jgi:hypothetical protein
MCAAVTSRTTAATCRLLGEDGIAVGRACAAAETSHRLHELGGRAAHPEVRARDVHGLERGWGIDGEAAKLEFKPDLTQAGRSSELILVMS